MLGEAQMRRQLAEMKMAQLESVTHEITGREEGREGREERGKKEEGGREGGERGTEGERGRRREFNMYINLMLITHSKCILTSVTS